MAKPTFLHHLAAFACVVFFGAEALGADPTAADALAFTPIQPGVEYDRPTAEEAKRATIKPEKEGKATSWVVRSESGQLLRRFADTNEDNLVDRWSYYQNGIEVYRDIDANYNGKADQYRWLHQAGMRWGIDDDEDGRIDSWKRVSPHEVAELAVLAITTSNAKLFGTLLPSSSEIQSLGLGSEATKQLASSVKEARSGFAELAAKQEVLSSASKFLDFGASRPGVIPADTSGSTRDVVYYENVTVLVDAGGKSEQVYLGQILQFGSDWRLVALPAVGDDSEGNSPFTLAASTTTSETPGDTGPPSDDMQRLMNELYKLDDPSAAAKIGSPAKVMARKAEIIEQLARMSPAAEAEQWYSQLADMLSTAVSMQNDRAGIKQLEQLSDKLRRAKASDNLLAHVEFRRIWAEYGLSQQDPKADVAKVQSAWLESLEAFVEDFDSTPDTAEAMLQLGMGNEFAGETETAIEWYGKLAKQFPRQPAGEKATGAIRRLDSIGKSIPLAGTALRGGKVDLRSYRGKVVLVQYWATWCTPCRDDMETIAQLYAKYRRSGFEVLGVNLDTSTDAAAKLAASQKLPWKSISDGQGLDGALANEMGVMTLPLMLLVDEDGKVLNRNIYMGEVEPELKRLLK